MNEYFAGIGYNHQPDDDMGIYGYYISSTVRSDDVFNDGIKHDQGISNDHDGFSDFRVVELPHFDSRIASSGESLQAFSVGHVELANHQLTSSLLT